MEAGNVVAVIGDGAYDSTGLLKYLESNRIVPMIRPRRDARTDRSLLSRRSAARMVSNIDIELGAK